MHQRRLVAGGRRGERARVLRLCLPEPPGCPEAPIRPEAGAYHAQLREWVLPYEAVRTAPDPDAAASHFNWLVMGEPVNRAMLLGDAAIPDEDWRRNHVHDAVNVFLAAYGRG